MSNTTTAPTAPTARALSPSMANLSPTPAYIIPCSLRVSLPPAPPVSQSPAQMSPPASPLSDDDDVVVPTTPTTDAFHEFVTTSPSPPPEFGCSRLVRFDSECVVIPETSSKYYRELHKAQQRAKSPVKRLVVQNRSYSLPLWKVPSKKDKGALSASSGEEEQTEDESKVVMLNFKVPIPRFSSGSQSPRHSRSVSLDARGRRASRSPPKPALLASSPPAPLSSCLVHRPPASLPSSPTVPSHFHPSIYTNPHDSSEQSLSRSVSPPSSHLHSLHFHGHTHQTQPPSTVPLRPCCPDCQATTEECLRALNDGGQWMERFSRGAARRRRRSSSASSAGRGEGGAPYAVVGVPEVVVRAASSEDETHEADRASLGLGIAVDEVDKLQIQRELLEVPFGSAHDRDSSTESSGSSSSSSSDVSLTTRGDTISSAAVAQRLLRHKHKGQRATSNHAGKRGSPPKTEDEDDAQLFPLPRSPRTSPKGTPKGSPESTPRSGTPLGVTDATPRASPRGSRRGSVNGDVNVLSEGALMRRETPGRQPEEGVAFPNGEVKAKDREERPRSRGKHSRTVSDPLASLSYPSQPGVSALGTVPNLDATPRREIAPRPEEVRGLGRGASPRIAQQAHAVQVQQQTHTQSASHGQQRNQSRSPVRAGSSKRQNSFSLGLRALKDVGVDVLKGVSSIGGGMTGGY